MIGKIELRREMIGKRKTLTGKEIAQKSGAVCALLLEALACGERNEGGSLSHSRSKRLPPAKIETVMIYLPAHGEVDTGDIKKWLFEKGKRVVVPISDTKTETIILSRITDKTKYKRGAYGILEPEKILPINKDEIDLIIAPGVAFDIKCSRLGHGKGYYDKLLREADAYKTGICYDFQITEEIPVKSHDVPMDMVITDRRIIQ